MSGMNWNITGPGTQRRKSYAKTDLGTMIERLGDLDSRDMRWVWQHVAQIAELNDDDYTMRFLAAAVSPEDATERAVAPSLMMMLNEFAAAGKEITLRKMVTLFDPAGEAITIPGGLYSHVKPGDDD